MDRIDRNVLYQEITKYSNKATYLRMKIASISQPFGRSIDHSEGLGWGFL